MNEDLERQLDAHENRMERLVSRIVGPIHERLARIEAKVDKTNGRVSMLESDKAAGAAAAAVRREIAHETAVAAAEKTQEILNERQRSRKWWLGIGSLVIAAIGVVVPLTNAALHALLH